MWVKQECFLEEEKKGCSERKETEIFVVAVKVDVIGLCGILKESSFQISLVATKQTVKKFTIF